MAIIRRGQEPANIKKRLDILFPKLDEAYPNKVIIGLQRDHKKWDETAREISKQLGYENKNDFLTAYGYKIEKLEGGRPSGDHMAIIDELKKRYPNGTSFEKMDELKHANPDLAAKFKTLSNRSKELFGMTLADYFKSIGLLGGSDHKKQLDELITELKRRYPAGSTLPATQTKLKEDNADLMMTRLVYIKEFYGVNPQEFLVKEGLIKEIDPKTELANFVAEIRERYAGKMTPGSLDQLKKENADMPFSSADNWSQETQGMSLVQHLKRERIISLENRQLYEAQKAAASKPSKGVLEFKGRVFVATALEEREKREIEEAVILRGGIYRTSVSKNTDYLIINPHMSYPSPKYRAAKEWISRGVNIQIYTYKAFLDLIRLRGDDDLLKEDFIINDGILDKYIGKDSVVSIPENVVEIGKGAFKECNHVVSITIPSSVKAISNNAFQYCSNLETVVFCGENLQSIGNSAFYGCINLRGIVLPNSVKEMGERVFVGCSSLSSIKLSDSLQSIPYRTFRFIVGLKVFRCPFTNIVIPNSVTEIDSDAFEGCDSLQQINIPANVKNIEVSAFNGCTALTEYLVDAGNKVYSSDSQGALFNKSKTTLIEVPSGKTGTYIVPDSVFKIDGWALRNCDKLQNVVFLGDMPLFKKIAMSSIEGGIEHWDDCYYNLPKHEIKAYYPKNNPSWKNVQLMSFESDVRWIPYDDLKLIEHLL